jgi:TonB family protein
LFSLAIVLYECLTGYVPFKGETPLITINLILSGSYKSLKEARPDVPIWLDQLMSRLLERNPDNRAASSGNDLAQLLEGQGPMQRTFKSAAKISKSVATRRKSKKDQKKPHNNRWIFDRLRIKIMLGLLALIVSSIIILIIVLSIQINSQKENNNTQQNIPPPIHETFNSVIPVPADTIIKSDTVKPSYRGGSSAIQKFLESQVKYPVEAREAGIKGTVIVGFLVKPDGSISGVSVLSGILTECDLEVLNAVYRLPNEWIPGKINNSPVTAYTTISYTFK